jgi:hypothetical protein
LTGSSPLAFTAATKSERILAKRLEVIPEAIGLTLPRPSLIVFIARGMATGVLPSRSATRFFLTWRFEFGSPLPTAA